NDSGQAAVPSDVTNIIAISAGDWFSLALRADGTVTGWGDNYWGQVWPPLSATNVAAISGAGTYPPIQIGHSLAIRGDGVALAWGTTGMDNVMCRPTLQTSY